MNFSKISILGVLLLFSAIALSGCILTDISTDKAGVKSLSFTVNSGFIPAEFPSKKVLSIDFDSGKTVLTKYFAGLKNKAPESIESTNLSKEEIGSLKKLLLENGLGLSEKYSLPEGQAVIDASGAQIKVLFAVPANERTIEIYPYSIDLSGLEGNNIEGLKKIVSKLQELMDKLENETINESNVVLSTNKTKYVVGETIRFVLKNNSGKSVFFYNDSADIQAVCGNEFSLLQLVDGNWKKANLLDPKQRVFCESSVLFELLPGKSATFNWNGTAFVENQGTFENQPIAGTFKVQAFYYSTEFSEGRQSIESNEFEIMENQVELTYYPIQCGGNPWEEWHSDLNRVYIRAPTEEEILKEYYSTVQGISIISYKNIPAPADLIVCKACDCPRGDTIEIEVFETDKAKMLELGWKEI